MLISVNKSLCTCVWRFLVLAWNQADRAGGCRSDYSLFDCSRTYVSVSNCSHGEDAFIYIFQMYFFVHGHLSFIEINIPILVYSTVETDNSVEKSVGMSFYVSTCMRVRSPARHITCVGIC